MWRNYVREFPLLGGLIDCDGRDHWESLGQTTVITILSTAPIWLATLMVFASANHMDVAAFKAALYGTVANGELFMYCTALLAPIFWVALVDPPRARVFPSKRSHMFLIAIIDLIAAVFFGQLTAGKKVNEQFVIKASAWMFVISLLLLYLGTVYHASRLPDAGDEFKKDEDDFRTAYSEHKQ